MLEVEQRVGPLERRVVDPGEVPDHVVREPERERDERIRQRPNDRRACERSRRAPARARARREAEPTRRGRRSAAGASSAGSACRACGSVSRLTASRSAVAPRKQAIRQPGAGKRRSVATYAAVRPSTTSASGFHDHAYGSTALRYSGAGVAQLVERQPSKLDVAGSSPVARLEEEPPLSGLFCRLPNALVVRESSVHSPLAALPRGDRGDGTGDPELTAVCDTARLVPTASRPRARRLTSSRFSSTSRVVALSSSSLPSLLRASRTSEPSRPRSRLLRRSCRSPASTRRLHLLRGRWICERREDEKRHTNGDHDAANELAIHPLSFPIPIARRDLLLSNTSESLGRGSRRWRGLSGREGRRLEAGVRAELTPAREAGPCERAGWPGWVEPRATVRRCRPGAAEARRRGPASHAPA